MSGRKEIRMKRLKRSHIWPSIVFLMLSVLFSILTLMSGVSLTVGFLTDDRYNLITDNALTITHALDAGAGSEEEVLKIFTNDTEAIYVLDADGSTIAGFGGQTYDRNKEINDFISDNIDNIDNGFKIGVKVSTEDIQKLADAEEKVKVSIENVKNEIHEAAKASAVKEEPFRIYADTAEGLNLIDKNGNLDFSYILSGEGKDAFKNADPNSNVPLFRAVFWSEYELSGGRTAMIKCVIPYYPRDFTYAMIMASATFALTFIPLIFMFINVLMNVHSQRRITKLLYTDTVTAGNSYIYFENAANKLLSRYGSNKIYAIADITLVKYRVFCNCHGAKAGEELLEAVDRKINTCLKRGEICAHSGKSSFAVLINCPDKESGEARIRNIENELTNTFKDDCILFHSGVYFSEPGRPRTITDASDCFNRAGAARALLTDDNQTALAVYDDKLLEDQLWEHKVEERMEQALENEEFKVYVQPKYDPVTEKLAGGEALVRWINDEDGFVPPGKFIPIFEKNGFITKLDDYMISHVARLQSQWLAEGRNIVPVSVNVSRAHFANPDLANHICRLVDQYNVPHKYIEIELTESAFFDDKAALLRTVHNLSELEFEISMDDFGAGYSSLNSLKDLPLDVLKLDADFFRGEDSENRGEIVVSQAIALAKKLNMRIVAEGVEKKEQVDFLAGQGCDMIQGYYFAKPMPADEYAERLNAPKAIGTSEEAVPASEETAPASDVSKGVSLVKEEN